MDTEVKDRATRIIESLSSDDAWLCSIPHGQYETHVPYSKAQAIEKVRDALREVEGDGRGI